MAVLFRSIFGVKLFQIRYYVCSQDYGDFIAGIITDQWKSGLGIACHAAAIKEFHFYMKTFFPILQAIIFILKVSIEDSKICEIWKFNPGTIFEMFWLCIPKLKIESTGNWYLLTLFDIVGHILTLFDIVGHIYLNIRWWLQSSNSLWEHFF